MEITKVTKRSFLFKKVVKSRYLLLLVLPCLLYYILLKYLPMFGIIISFKDYNAFKGVWESNWVGFKYYKMFLESPDFFLLMKNTLLLGIMKLLLGFPAPIILALMLNELKQSFLKRFVQSASYLPHFISNVVVAGMVTLFLSPTSGIINAVIKAFGFEPINFLVLPEMFRFIYVLSDIWQHVGWEAIIYLAALTAIDPQLYEAVEMDGANRWKKLIHVTLPGIFPVIIILLLINVGNVLEIGFEKVFLLYNPATYSTADIISTYVYRAAFVAGNYSYATAIDMFTAFISLILIYSANRVSRKLGETSLW